MDISVLLLGCAVIKVGAVIEKLAEIIPRENIVHQVDLPAIHGPSHGFVDQTKRFGNIRRFAEVQRRPDPVETQNEGVGKTQRSETKQAKGLRQQLASGR